MLRGHEAKNFFDMTFKKNKKLLAASLLLLHSYSPPGKIEENSDIISNIRDM